MKKELSEKQLEAKRIFSQIVQIDMTEVPVDCVNKYGHEYTHTCVMCKVNGTKYIQLSTLDHHCERFFQVREKMVRCMNNDFLYCRRGGNYQYRGHVIRLIRVSTVMRYKDEALQYIREREPDDYTALRNIFKTLEDEAVELPEITIDKAILFQSQTLYLKRFRLLQEDAHERRKEKARKLLEGLKNEQKNQEDETLKDLVSKIESMGWDVTLSIKPV